MVKKGTWVSVRSTILAPDERAEGIPHETSKTPLVMWVKGFLTQDAEFGTEATVKTRVGRIKKGVLEEAEPSTNVDYGNFVPEIMNIGEQAREILFGGGK